MNGSSRDLPVNETLILQEICEIVVDGDDDGMSFVTAVQRDDASEKGGIAHIVHKLNEKMDKQSRLETDRAKTYSPPIKEIFIPTNHQYGFGFYVEPVWSMKTEVSRVQTKKGNDVLSIVPDRVRTKKDNDRRIQNIMKRGKDRFFSRRNKKKAEVAE